MKSRTPFVITAVLILIFVACAFYFPRVKRPAGKAMVPVAQPPRLDLALSPAGNSSVPSINSESPVIELRAKPRLSFAQQRCRADFEHALDGLTGLHLTIEQKQKLEDVFCSTFAARMDFEVSHAKMGVIPSTSAHVIEIASYPDFGRQLRGELEASFRNILGAELSAQLQEQLFAFLESRTANWGIYPQQMIVEYDSVKNTYFIQYALDPGPAGGYRREFGDEMSPEMAHEFYEEFLPLFPSARRL